MLEDISHPFIVRVFELVEDEHNYYIISELMNHGDLDKYVKKRHAEGQIEEEETKIIAEEILLALNFMHSQNLVHRDLKP